MQQTLVAHTLAALRHRGWTVAVAEGDTGGVLLEWLTAGPGSSAAVRGGVVAYHDDLKRALLGVPAEVIVAHGAVSAETCTAMAAGVRTAAGAEVGLATTGIAGPSGGRPGKPVGVAFVAVATAAGTVWRAHQWAGDRAANRAATASAALALAVEVLVGDDEVEHSC